MSLPPLREELRIQEAGQDWDASPCWLIHDPAANRFHRIGWLEFEFLARWETESPAKLLERVCAETSLRPTEEDLINFISFLDHNCLLRVSAPGSSARLSARAKTGRLSLEQWLLHNYLFFRIPLLKPDALLERLMPLAAPLMSMQALLVYALLTVSGLFLVARQWDLFSASFVNTLTPSGFISYFMALAVAKCVHELGHALLAKRAGLRVPRIGIAFMVMFPVLYTDLGEGWLLSDHRLRRLISAGGILAEAVLAGVALFLWGMLDNGALRDAFYILAVVSLTRSLLINITPFMRFDGYYLLSDHFDLPNLQQRAFALTRYLLRRTIFGYSEAPPEQLPPRLILFFTLYSVSTWIYRLVVFLGIAVTVYLYFFKSLGIFLMLVELLYFIAFPILKEMAAWRGYMKRISFVRSAALGGVVFLLLLLFLTPWRGRVILPAMLTARVKQPVYAPFAARVTSVSPPGKAVAKGDRLFVLDAEESRFQSGLAKMQVAELRDRLRRFPVESKGREQAAVWREEALEREQAVKSHSAELHRLELSAESDGVLLEVDDGVHPGSYVTSHALLGLVVHPSSAEIEAFAEETDSARIRPGARVTFYRSSQEGQPLKGHVLSLDSNRLTSLPTPALADRHGGVIATLPSSGDRLVPRDSLYRLRIKLDAPPAILRLETGFVSVEVEPESLALRLVRQAVSVLVRESGF